MKRFPVVANRVFLLLDGLGLCPCKLAERIVGDQVCGWCGSGSWRDAVIGLGMSACGWLVLRMPDDPKGQQLYERIFQ